MSLRSMVLKTGSWSAYIRWYMIPCRRERDRWLGFCGRDVWVKTWPFGFRGRYHRHSASNDGGRDDLACSLVIKMLLLTITISGWLLQPIRETRGIGV